VGEIADELRLLLFEKAQALAVTIEALEMMPDIENPRWLRERLAKLRRLQPHASRQVRGSSRQKETYRQIARLPEQLANPRADDLHKASNQVIADHDWVAIENLSLGLMNRNGHLSLSSHDAGLGLFRQMLEYKAESAGTQVSAVKSFQTTQACSGCGSVIPKGWSVRIHVCPDCGLVIDRDVHAACHILTLALNNPPRRSGQVVTYPIGECIA